MTYTQIGNYGVTPEDDESVGPHIRGFVIEELSPVASNFRSRQDLASYFSDHKIIGIQGVHENVPPFVADNLIWGQRGAIPAQDLSASLGNADGFDATKTSFNLAQIALRRFRQPITHREGTHWLVVTSVAIFRQLPCVFGETAARL